VHLGIDAYVFVPKSGVGIGEFYLSRFKYVYLEWN
jgi:hypothetical protein